MPPLTRASAIAKRQKSQVLLPGFAVPSELVLRSLVFCDLPSLVILASCSKTLQWYAFGTHWMWREIDFGLIDARKTAKLTDPQLAALLRRVNAKHCTRVLRLTGCTQIRGAGLDPLRGSCALEEIDLRLEWSHRGNSFGPPGFDERRVFRILSSLSPINSQARTLKRGTFSSPNSLGLSLVKIRRQRESDSFFDSYSEETTEFFLSFHAALQDQAIARRTKCGFCHEVIAENHSEEDMWWVMSSCYCEYCRKYSCQTGACPLSGFCRDCSLQCCQCVDLACPSPKNDGIRACMECHRGMCFNCNYYHHGSQFCHGCSEVFCKTCAPESMDFCESCDQGVTSATAKSAGKRVVTNVPLLMFEGSGKDLLVVHLSTVHLKSLSS